jgi:hypothetical protein
VEFVFSPADEKFLKRFADVVRLQQQDKAEGSYVYEVFVDGDGHLDYIVWYFYDLQNRIDTNHRFCRSNCILLFLVQANSLGVFTERAPLCTDALLDFFLEQL